MKVLSVRQPHATLIALRFKRIETRSWGTRYRGPVAIHASVTPPTVDIIEPMLPALRAFFLLPLGTLGEIMRRVLALPTGRVVAFARLYDCRPAEVLIPPGRVHVDERFNPGPWEHATGYYGPKRVGLLLDHATPLPAPVPHVGRLGLRDWNPPLLSVAPVTVNLLDRWLKEVPWTPEERASSRLIGGALCATSAA